MRHSRYSKYWYGSILGFIKHKYDLEKDKSMQAVIYLTAIRNAERETLKLPDGEDRLRAIEMIYYKKTHSPEGAAAALYISRRKLYRWCRAFVYAVAKNAGF